MMIAVGAAAIEMGLVSPKADTTMVKIRAVNTGAKVVATLQTPNREVTYAGSTAIDGVPGVSAPIAMDFTDVAGSATGTLLPTGNLCDTVNGVTVTCLDFAMPMVISQAAEFGLTGYETQKELDANKDFFKRMEGVRLKAGELMGMGDCSESVTPKFGLIARANAGGTLCTRYFMPWSTHPTLAVTGSQCLAACATMPGTVADGLLNRPKTTPATLKLEHPLGKIEIVLNFDTRNDRVTPMSAGVVRTARKLAQGEVFIPASIRSIH
jgi:2-methylaconitate cis-trans-isomerase PrpF